MSDYEARSFSLTNHAIERIRERFGITEYPEIVKKVTYWLENGAWYSAKGKRGKGKSFCVYGDGAILYNEADGVIITVLERTKARYSVLSNRQKQVRYGK